MGGPGCTPIPAALARRPAWRASFWERHSTCRPTFSIGVTSTILSFSAGRPHERFSRVKLTLSLPDIHPPPAKISFILCGEPGPHVGLMFIVEMSEKGSGTQGLSAVPGKASEVRQVRLRQSLDSGAELAIHSARIVQHLADGLAAGPLLEPGIDLIIRIKIL